MKVQRGFTLIELAIVLVIVTILVGGLAMPLSAQIQARRVAETKRTLEEAREAIIGYAMTHPGTPATNRRLPCPDTDGDGNENRDGSGSFCAAESGFFPWVDLGVAAQDAWGNRLRYAISTGLAHPNAGFSASTTLAQPLVICTSHTCSPASPDVANNLAFAVVSHGPNGWGAQNMNNAPGILQAAPSGLDETANLNGDRIYVSRAPSDSGSASGEFDDLPAWISFPQLIARVCPYGSDCAP